MRDSFREGKRVATADGSAQYVKDAPIPPIASLTLLTVRFHHARPMILWDETGRVLWLGCRYGRSKLNQSGAFDVEVIGVGHLDRDGVIARIEVERGSFRQVRIAGSLQ